MILEGKTIAGKIYEDVKSQISKLDKKPKLVAILVGNNSSSIRYINQKQKWALYVGMVFELIHLSEKIKEKELINEIEKLNNDPNTSGFIVQLPLPKHINTTNIINSINPLKDVDGFHPINQGKIVLGDNSGLTPCTPSGIVELLKYYDIDVKGKNVVVIGRSNIVGKPILNMLVNMQATVSICNSLTKDINYYTKNADIIITAIGVPRFLKSENIKKDSILIDVGFSIVDDKIYGDCDFDNIQKQGNKITPVPGGVGALTVAMLIKNTLKANNIINNG